MTLSILTLDRPPTRRRALSPIANRLRCRLHPIPSNRTYPDDRRMAQPRSPANDGPQPLDRSWSESDAWLDALRRSGPTRDQAVARLHALLIRAARWQVARCADARDVGHGDIATRAADDALRAVLISLDEVRQPTRFATWACKFALIEAAAGVRRHVWQQRPVGSDPDGWVWTIEALTSPDCCPADAALLRAVVPCIRDDLTADQRRVLVAVAIEKVPLDVLAERLNVTRGTLHATLHDARRRVRGALDEKGLLVEAPCDEA